MSSHNYYDTMLEIARRLCELKPILTDIYQSRGESIQKIINESKGEKPEDFATRHKEDGWAFDKAVGELDTYEQYWIDRWVTYVGHYNTATRERAVSELDYALELYHSDIVLEQNFVGNLGNLAHRFGDWITDIPGGVGIRVDEADKVVPSCRDPERPMPPGYHPAPAFVRYERKDTADPTRGVYEYYDIRPTN